jgi:hypothetical protein
MKPSPSKALKTAGGKKRALGGRRICCGDIAAGVSAAAISKSRVEEV